MKETEVKESKDKRRFERFKIKLNVKFIDLNKNKAGEAFTHDFCAEGIGLITQEELSPKTPVELWLYIRNHHDPLYLKGEVVWSKPIDFNTYRVGINLEQTELIGLSRIFRCT